MAELDEIMLLLRQQSDAFQAQMVALQADLQATKGLIQAERYGGGGETAPSISGFMRLDVPKFLGTDPDRWIFSFANYFTQLSTAKPLAIKWISPAERLERLSKEDALEGGDISILNSLVGYGSPRRVALDIQGLPMDVDLQANQKRRDVEFNVGDIVLVKLQPYRQVLERVEKVAYRLALPYSCKIHLVFHVSLLKPSLGTGEEQVTNLLEDEHEGQPVEQPLAICDTRIVLQKGIPVRQVLVQWNGRPPEEATWEWLLKFKIAYPSYHLEDKVIFEGEGNDTLGPELMAERPKKEKSKPVWHKDYVI
ncbi:ty3-gypsy retrotransposon protein [Tanacetum coccineum]|uniref:Ty3-gypsy retrotransposon protein n=1 Tax=Tanacetum coccineum TaxID=301880 RepID=A0ABQ5B1J0_9ASTR